jgi:predicted Rdx family selenoprotein
VELIKGSGGRFEVIVDGHAVFRKSIAGRHAQPGEVVKLIEQGSGR